MLLLTTHSATASSSKAKKCPYKPSWNSLGNQFSLSVPTEPIKIDPDGVMRAPPLELGTMDALPYMLNVDGIAQRDIKIGDVLQLRVSATQRDGTLVDVSHDECIDYKTDSEGSISVNGKGMIHALKAGRSAIRVEYLGLKSIVWVSVGKIRRVMDLMGIYPGMYLEEIETYLGNSIHFDSIDQIYTYPVDRWGNTNLIVIMEANKRPVRAETVTLHARDADGHKIPRNVLRGIRLGATRRSLHAAWGKPLAIIYDEERNESQMHYPGGLTVFVSGNLDIVTGMSLTLKENKQIGTIAWYMSQGANYYSRQLFRPALDAFSQAFHLAPGDPHIRIWQGRSSFMNGQFAVAYTALAESENFISSVSETSQETEVPKELLWNGGSAEMRFEFYMKLGVAASKSLKYQEGYPSLQKALKTLPSLKVPDDMRKLIGAELLYNSAVCLEGMGRYEESLLKAESAQKLQPNDDEISDMVRRLKDALAHKIP